MLKNYLKVAIRNLRNHKGYSFINIFGLAVGLACSFFIFLWVQDEMSFNNFHAEEDQIFRVMQHATFGGRIGIDNRLESEYDQGQVVQSKTKAGESSESSDAKGRSSVRELVARQRGDDYSRNEADGRAAS